MRLSVHCEVLLTLFQLVVGIDFSVEEEPAELPSGRHLHNIRHHRDQKYLPYKSAASTLTNPLSQQYESFSLNCPHVADASNTDVGIHVTWTLNDTIWLKIEDGEKRIYNKLTTFNKRTVGGKKVLRVLLNNGRYFFDYDELTGDFAMEIRPVNVPEDAGVWQCHVTVLQQGNTHTLTSRSRVKIPHEHRLHDKPSTPTFSPRSIYETFPLMPLSTETKRAYINKGTSISSTFSRNDQELVHINRDETTRPLTVVFNRQNGPSSQMHAQPEIDYEVSMSEDLYYNSPRSRVRSAFYSDSQPYRSSLTSMLSLFVYTVIFIVFQ